MTIKDLPDAQVVRLYRRVLHRIHYGDWGEGGGMFGVDWTTLNYCRPGLARTYNDVKAELIRRRDDANR